MFADLAVSWIFEGGISTGSLYEAFADLTLMYGFLPASNIQVIGVGWTLGVIFGFYCLFPLFVYLIWNKKRAWGTLLVAIGLNYACKVYFLADGDVVGCNVLLWLCYFVAGGLIYLYREAIISILKDKKKFGLLISFFGLMLVFSLDIPFGVVFSTMKSLIGFSLVVIGAMTTDSFFWYNSMTKFISKISLEIYLSQLMIFRIIQKFSLLYLFDSAILSYITAVLLTLLGTITFAIVYQYIEKKCRQRINSCDISTKRL